MADDNKTAMPVMEKAPIKVGDVGRTSGRAQSDSGELGLKSEKKKKKKGIGAKILPFFLLILIIASFVGVLVYNVFDIREKYLRSTIDKIPIISGLLLAPGTEDEFRDYSRDDLIARIDELNAKLNEAQALSADKDQRIETHLQEIANLKVFEEQQLDFLNEKADFDRQVAEGNPSAYANFYESIWPDNASELYINAVISVTNSTEWKKYINKVAGMDEKSAARMLEELIPTDMPIVVDILRNLKDDQASAILSSMDTQMAAAVVKQMYPT